MVDSPGTRRDGLASMTTRAKEVRDVNETTSKNVKMDVNLFDEKNTEKTCFQLVNYIFYNDISGKGVSFPTKTSFSWKPLGTVVLLMRFLQGQNRNLHKN